MTVPAKIDHVSTKVTGFGKTCHLRTKINI